MKELNKKIEELKKGCGTELDMNCGDCRKGWLCPHCEGSIYAFQEAQKIIDEKVKELKEKILDYDVIDPKLSLFLVNIQERFTVDVDKIFGGKNDL